ncbi:MAG: hypothetical protein J2P37_31865, partial [Ktedonobacteraceae bacterium]|nr:hypothetical protein [Ktedonobacteraceae bacterium]
MATNNPYSADVRATLLLSAEEAQTGTQRMLTLPGGRPYTVTIPAGAYNGQEITIPGQGFPRPDGALGNLIITLSIA